LIELLGRRGNALLEGKTESHYAETTLAGVGCVGDCCVLHLILHFVAVAVVVVKVY